MKCDFSYRHYLEILEKFKKKGYSFALFDENPKDKVVWLRHDLDHSISKAVLMADLERSIGAKATYCIRFASPFDNMFSRDNREAIDKIVNRGHDIALHYEREAWSDGYEKIDIEIEKQITILKQFFPSIKNIVSFHRPQEDVFNKRFDQFINTYDKPFFGDIKYLSDSTGAWRSGCPCVNLDTENKVNYQFLTHPVWWGREEGDSCKHLHNFFREKIKEWDQEYYDDNPFYTERFNEKI